MTIVFMFCFVFHANLKKSILDTFIVMTVLDIFGNPYQKLAHVNVWFWFCGLRFARNRQSVSYKKVTAGK